MSQPKTHAVSQSQGQAQAVPATSKPLPIDPSLLRQIGGGTGKTSPEPTW